MQVRLLKPHPPPLLGPLCHPHPYLLPHCSAYRHAAMTVHFPADIQFVASLQGEGASACLPPTLDSTMMRVHPKGWDQDGMLRLMASSVPASQSMGVVPARFWAAGFSFAKAQLITEVSCYLWLPLHTSTAPIDPPPRLSCPPPPS